MDVLIPQIIGVSSAPWSRFSTFSVHRSWKKVWSLSRLFPEAQLGAYPRTDRRRTSVQILRWTSATADRRRPRTTGHERNCTGCPVLSPGARLGECHRTNCGCASTSRFGRNRREQLLVRSRGLTCLCSPLSHCSAYTNHILPAPSRFPCVRLCVPP